MFAVGVMTATGAAWSSESSGPSFFEGNEPSDGTVSGDMECRGAIYHVAERQLKSALAGARKAIIDRSKRLTINASADLADPNANRDYDLALREHAEDQLDAAKSMLLEFDIEQQYWEKYAQSACGYLRNRSIYGANGPAILALACDINIVRDRMRHLLVLTDAVSNRD